MVNPLSAPLPADGRSRSGSGVRSRLCSKRRCSRSTLGHPPPTTCCKEGALAGSPQESLELRDGNDSALPRRVSLQDRSGQNLELHGGRMAAARVANARFLLDQVPGQSVAGIVVDAKRPVVLRRQAVDIDAAGAPRSGVLVFRRKARRAQQVNDPLARHADEPGIGCKPFEQCLARPAFSLYERRLQPGLA